MHASRTRLTLLVVPALLVTVLSLNALVTGRAESAIASDIEVVTRASFAIDQDLAGQPESRTGMPVPPSTENGTLALHVSRKARAGATGIKESPATAPASVATDVTTDHPEASEAESAVQPAPEPADHDSADRYPADRDDDNGHQGENEPGSVPSSANWDDHQRTWDADQDGQGEDSNSGPSSGQDDPSRSNQGPGRANMGTDDPSGRGNGHTPKEDHGDRADNQNDDRPGGSASGEDDQ